MSTRNHAKHDFALQSSGFLWTLFTKTPRGILPMNSNCEISFLIINLPIIVKYCFLWYLITNGGREWRKIMRYGKISHRRWQPDLLSGIWYRTISHAGTLPGHTSIGKAKTQKLLQLWCISNYLGYVHGYRVCGIIIVWNLLWILHARYNDITWTEYAE